MNRDKMRRAHAGQFYEPVPQQYDGDVLEQENEQMASHLKDKVSALKSLSIDIGYEIKQHDKLLRDMDDDFERSRGFLGNTMNRVLRLTKGGHNYYMLYLFLFSMFVFFVLYLYIKFR